MFEQARMLKMIRLTSAATVGITLLLGTAGIPPAASAFACYDYTMECTDVQSCVDRLHDDCYQPGPCTGEIFCRLASSTIDCNNDPGAEVAMTCVEVEPE